MELCWHLANWHLPTEIFDIPTKTSITILNSEKWHLNPALLQQKPEGALKLPFFTLVRVCLLNFMIFMSQEAIKCVQVIKSLLFWYLSYLRTMLKYLWENSASEASASSLECSYECKSDWYPGSWSLWRMQLRNNCHLDTYFLVTNPSLSCILIAPWGD